MTQLLRIEDVGFPQRHVFAGCGENISWGILFMSVLYLPRVPSGVRFRTVAKGIREEQGKEIWKIRKKRKESYGAGTCQIKCTFLLLNKPGVVTSG